MPRKHCLLVGDAEHNEFHTAVRWLAEQVQLTSFTTPAQALSAANSIPSVDFILLAQSRPGRFSAFQVETLHRQWPLARLYAVLGHWCEGEGRSGRPWPGVGRISAGNFVPRMSAELESSKRFSRSWRLPRLTSDAERFEFESTKVLPQATGVVLINAATLDDFGPLADAVRLAGYTAIWRPTFRIANSPLGRAALDSVASDIVADIPRIVASIWDATRGNAAEWQSIRNTWLAYNSTPLLITMGFPRVEDTRRARELSAETPGSPDRITVMAKPYRLAELCQELVALTLTTGTTAAIVAVDAGRHDRASSSVKGGV